MQQAQHLLAQHYESGDGVDVSYKCDSPLVPMSPARAHSDSDRRPRTLPGACALDFGGLPRRGRKAMQWYRRAAKAGEVTSLSLVDTRTLAYARSNTHSFERALHTRTKTPTRTQTRTHTHR